MTYRKLPKNIPDILRKHGLKVVEVDGWYGRGRPSSTGELAPVGVLCHHTATNKRTSNANVVSLLVKGRSDLPGPLCHFGLARDGTVYIVAAGRANHAGKAKKSGTVSAGDGNKLYWGIEAFNDGVGEPWNAVQYNAYVLLAAVLTKEVTKNSVETVRGHKETSITGKIDPTFNMTNFRSNVKSKISNFGKPAAPKPKPKPKPKPAAKPSGTVDFKVYLNPTNTHSKTALADVKDEMAQIKKLAGPHAVLFNTELHAKSVRDDAMKALGTSWDKALENEVMIAWRKTNWSLSGKPVGFKLAKDDPSKAKISPARAISEVPLQHKLFTGPPFMFLDTHWVSEANCIHQNVPGRAWREANYKVQLADWLNEVERLHLEGYPLVLGGDFNTGVFFTAHELFAKLQKRVGPYAKAVHLGGLDSIFTVDTDTVKFSEVGTEVKVNTKSDHDMVIAHLKATKV